MMVKESPGSQSIVLWREWRHLPTEKHAFALFQVLLSLPIGWRATAYLAAISGLYGGSLVGLVVQFAFPPASTYRLVVVYFLSMCVSATVLLVVRPFLRRCLTWERWFLWQVGAKPTEEYSSSGFWGSLGQAWVFSLFGVIFYLFLELCGTPRSVALLVTSLLLLAFFVHNLGRSSLLWNVWMVGYIAAFLLVTAFCVRWGLEIWNHATLACAFCAPILTGVFGACWFFVRPQLVSIPELHRELRRLQHLLPIPALRPAPSSVITALRTFGRLSPRADHLVGAIDAERKTVLETNAAYLRNNLGTHYAMQLRGGETAEWLRSRLGRFDESILRWIYEGVQMETASVARSRRRGGYLVCPQCYLLAKWNHVAAAGKRYRIFGCRNCLRSAHLISARKVIVMISDMNEIDDLPCTAADGSGDLRIHWRLTSGPVDFTEVHVRGATDNLIEHFLCQVGNNRFRQRVWPRSRSRVSPRARSSISTIVMRAFLHFFPEEDSRQPLHPVAGTPT